MLSHARAATARMHISGSGRQISGSGSGRRAWRGGAPHQVLQVRVLAVVGRALVVHVGDHVVQEGDIRGLAPSAQQTRSGPMGRQAAFAVGHAEPGSAAVESRRCHDGAA